MKAWAKKTILFAILVGAALVGAGVAGATEKAGAWHLNKVAQALEKAHAEGCMAKKAWELNAETLLELVNAPCPQVRGAAIYALGELKDPRAVGALIRRLTCNDSYDQRMAARALAKIADPRAVEPLGRLLNDRSQPLPVRRDTAEALGCFSLPQAAWALAQIGPDQNASLQKRVQLSLERVRQNSQRDAGALVQR